jgi:hypothetical protein
MLWQRIKKRRRRRSWFALSKRSSGRKIVFQYRNNYKNIYYLPKQLIVSICGPREKLWWSLLETTIICRILLGTKRSLLSIFNGKKKWRWKFWEILCGYALCSSMRRYLVRNKICELLVNNSFFFYIQLWYWSLKNTTIDNFLIKQRTR